MKTWSKFIPNRCSYSYRLNIPFLHLKLFLRFILDRFLKNNGLFISFFKSFLQITKSLMYTTDVPLLTWVSLISFCLFIIFYHLNSIAQWWIKLYFSYLPYSLNIKSSKQSYIYIRPSPLYLKTTYCYMPNKLPWW